MGNCAEICISHKKNLTFKLEPKDINEKNKTTILSEQSSFIQSLNIPKFSNRDITKNNKILHLVSMKKSIKNKSVQRNNSIKKNGIMNVKYTNKNDNKEVFEENEIEKSLHRNNSYVNKLNNNSNININQTDIDLNELPLSCLGFNLNLIGKRIDEDIKSPQSQIYLKRNRPIFSKLLKYSKSKENIK
jgi:hypothetical protein